MFKPNETRGWRPLDVAPVQSRNVRSRIYAPRTFRTVRLLLPVPTSATQGSTVLFKSFCYANSGSYANGKRIKVIISSAESKIKSLTAEDNVYSFTMDCKETH